MLTNIICSYIFSILDRLPQSLTTGAQVTPEEGGAETEDSEMNLSEADVEGLTMCLEEITKVYALAPTLIVNKVKIYMLINIIKHI